MCISENNNKNSRPTNPFFPDMFLSYHAYSYIP